MRPIISAGAVIFRREHGDVKFLLLYHGKNYWNFPKGKLEAGERAMSAFIREVEEETGLKHHDLKILSGFQARDRYFLAPPGLQAGSERGRAVLKIVIYYLVETRRREVTISHEHEGFAWFGYHDAIRAAKYKNTQAILKQAYEFIRKGIPRSAKHSPRHGRHLR